MKPAGEGVLQKWPVSKRVNSSCAPDTDNLTDAHSPSLLYAGYQECGRRSLNGPTAATRIRQSERSRCEHPASGYYEWHDAPGGKQPYYFTRRDGIIVSAEAALVGRTGYSLIAHPRSLKARAWTRVGSG
jgi:hypothetical protein